MAKRIELEAKIDVLEDTSINRLELLKNFIFEANTAEKWLSEENWPEMKNFLKKVGSNRLLRAQKLTVGSEARGAYWLKPPWPRVSATKKIRKDTNLYRCALGETRTPMVSQRL